MLNRHTSAPIASISALVFTALIATLGFTSQEPQPRTHDEIQVQIAGLRALPDKRRAAVTKQLAFEIRELPAGTQKRGLAMMLANLATEGDFGRETIQEVANTLAQSVHETPIPGSGTDPGSPYMELAELARYENLKIPLDAPQFWAALAKVDAIDHIREKADFKLQDLTGKTWTLSSLRGKVVLVNFWATWCPPCRKEMPDLQALYNDFKSRGLVVLAISNEDAKTVATFIGQHRFDFPVLLDPGNKVNRFYQIGGIPKSFIYNRQGKLVAQSIDMRTREQFLELLSKAGLQ